MDLDVLVDILARIGVDLSLDWDDTLQITVPEHIKPMDLKAAIERHAERLAKHVLWRARLQQATFVGGPMDGQRHRNSSGALILVHKARGEWHAYRVDNDMRARYLGQATSRKKATPLLGKDAWGPKFIFDRR